jgi:hypothetical protein
MPSKSPLNRHPGRLLREGLKDCMKTRIKNVGGALVDRVASRIEASIAASLALEPRTTPATKIGQLQLWHHYRSQIKAGRAPKLCETGFRCFSQFDTPRNKERAVLFESIKDWKYEQGEPGPKFSSKGPRCSTSARRMVMLQPMRLTPDAVVPRRVQGEAPAPRSRTGVDSERWARRQKSVPDYSKTRAAQVRRSSFLSIRIQRNMLLLAG